MNEQTNEILIEKFEDDEIYHEKCLVATIFGPRIRHDNWCRNAVCNNTTVYYFVDKDAAKNGQLKDGLMDNDLTSCYNEFVSMGMYYQYNETEKIISDLKKNKYLLVSAHVESVSYSCREQSRVEWSIIKEESESFEFKLVRSHSDYNDEVTSIISSEDVLNIINKIKENGFLNKKNPTYLGSVVNRPKQFQSCEDIEKDIMSSQTLLEIIDGADVKDITGLWYGLYSIGVTLKEDDPYYITLRRKSSRELADFVKDNMSVVGFYGITKEEITRRSKNIWTAMAWYCKNKMDETCGDKSGIFTRYATMKERYLEEIEQFNEDLK